MQRAIGSLPLSTHHIAKLMKNGFESAEDIKNFKPKELSTEIGVSLEEAVDIIRLVKDETNRNNLIKSAGKNKTAFELLQDENIQQYVVTFCERLDTILGGGIPVCQITEVSGIPGSGKTQICMQLAVAVQVPEIIGGLQGEAIYIDTEGSFIVDRVADIALASVEHCRSVSEEDLSNFTVESILSHIHYFRCSELVELIALMYSLPDFLQEHSKVRFIAVDSIAFHFRHNFEDFSARNRLLTHVTQNFLQIATGHHLAVVFTNHMTTRIDADGSHLAPALGDSWGHLPTNRIILTVSGNEHCAHLFKSAFLQEAFARFQITKEGIRDVAS